MPQLNAIGIVASDMARSIAFYRLLGLDVPETPEVRHIDTFLPNGLRLMLDSEDTIHSFNPGWVRARGNQLGLALELHARVAAAGFDAEEPFDADWGQRYCELRDPDGNPVDLYAAR
jgi:catechol 2,3-dioxygenase-like lactoylglutathione lyase family enzyme